MKEDPNHNAASLWRVSSTLFSHIASDQLLEPLPPFDNEETRKKYHAIKYVFIKVFLCVISNISHRTGEQVRKELEIIKLAAPSN